MSNEEHTDGEQSEDTDPEVLVEELQKVREKRKQQVSFEWVKTVREAGEIWRDAGDVEIVAEEADLPLETAREALKVYRLIFEDPPNVAIKALKPSRAYFSLEQELEDVFDEADEPVEELIQEYVGALYLEKDIEDLVVGDPPKKEKPPTGIEAGDIVPQPGYETFQAGISALNSALRPDLFQMEQLLTNVIQPALVQQELMFAQNMGPLITALEQQQTELAKSTVMMAEALQEVTLPETVIADLAALQPTLSVNISADTYSDFNQTIPDESSKTSVNPTQSEVVSRIGAEPTPWDNTLDVQHADSSNFTTELMVEVPAMVVEAMLSTGEARAWFSNLSEEYQQTAVQFLLMSVAFYLTGNPFVSSIAIVFAPAVRRTIIKEN